MMNRSSLHSAIAAVAIAALAAVTPVLGEIPATSHPAPINISGRYPHLAMVNSAGECGTGAVVPWADRLWVVTYSPHEPKGSDDKLYEIAPDLTRTVRPESVGGTPADRLIHRASDQLIIGPYFIDAQRNVRAITPQQMPGRLTAAATHLTDPADKVYLYDMEGALYEVDVHTLAVAKLFARAAEGHHGKGAYTSQGRLVIANNGNVPVNKATPMAQSPGYKQDAESSGCLAQWDGKAWSVVMPREFTDITGPGGIDGAPSNSSPLWCLGWDKRSVILELLDRGVWQTFRLPIADHSYTAAHGWYTEWPRIRDVGGGHLLMNMHGQWLEFPKTFSAANTAGIRAIGDYLKITGDVAPYAGRIVFGCDDASMMQNPLDGQSESNLWFTTWDGLHNAGRPDGTGGPWLDDAVKGGEPSAPYLFAGYDCRTLHLSQSSDAPVTFAVETGDGHGHWTPAASISVPANGYASHVFPSDAAGEWVRLTPDRDANGVSATFSYGSATAAPADAATFASLRDWGDTTGSAGVIRPAGHDRGTLLFRPTGGTPTEVRADMTFAADPAGDEPFPKAKPSVRVSADAASIVVTQGKIKVRLPRSPHCPGALDADARTERECVTERSLLNAGGTFYMLPRADAGGLYHLKPVATHDRRISDFCSWRGLMVLAGTHADAKPDGHFFCGTDHRGLWFGDIDDLWRMGKPTGHGGPWLNTDVAADAPSDPFLMAGFDRKSVALSHANAGPVKFTIEVDPAATGKWFPLTRVDVPAGIGTAYAFPDGFAAAWVRVRADIACRATAQFDYR
jgi:hypothetical protein